MLGGEALSLKGIGLNAVVQNKSGSLPNEKWRQRAGFVNLGMFF